MTSFTNESSYDANGLDIASRVQTSRLGGRASTAVCATTLLAADLGSIAACGAVISASKSIVAFLTPHATFSGKTPVAAIVALSACVILYLSLKGRYSDRIPFWSELRLVFSASWLTSFLLTVLALGLGMSAICSPIIATLLLFPFVATLGNWAAKRALARCRLWGLDVLVVGDGRELAAMELAFRAAPSLGYRVVRKIGPAALLSAPVGSRLRSLMHRYRAQRVVVALCPDHALHRHVVASALSERVDFVLAPKVSALDDLASDGASFLSHDAVLRLAHDERARLLSRGLKVGMDVALTALLLIALAPVFLAIAIANKCSGGPVFFAHRRIGLGGRSFPCLKFRTMRVDGDQILAAALAEDPTLRQEWETFRKLREDPRVTRVGRFLRKTSLDELPQLLNVIRLEMSLVGPRPIVESEVAFFGDDIVHYSSTRPGLTGLWQVSGRSNTSYSRRVKLDVWYVTHWTIWNDLAVLLKTIPAVLWRDGAH